MSEDNTILMTEEVWEKIRLRPLQYRRGQKALIAHNSGIVNIFLLKKIAESNGGKEDLQYKLSQYINMAIDLELEEEDNEFQIQNLKQLRDIDK